MGKNDDNDSRVEITDISDSQPSMARRFNNDDITTDALPRITDESSIEALEPSVRNQLVNLRRQGSFDSGFSDFSLVSQASVNNTLVQNAPTSIVVSGSSGVHIGDTHVKSYDINIGCKPKKKKTKKKDVPPEVLDKLCSSQQRVTSDHLRKVRIGKPWRMVMRELRLSDPDIENIHEHYIDRGGLEEVIYQLLRLWIEDNGPKATIDGLSKALWSQRQVDALLALAEMCGFVPQTSDSCFGKHASD